MTAVPIRPQLIPPDTITTALGSAIRRRSRFVIEAAVRRALCDGVFLFTLAIVLNAEALEVARVEGLRAAAAFYWMGCLLGGPRVDDLLAHEAETYRRELADCWAQWRAVVERLSLDRRVEGEAQARLEREFFGGHDVLFADASEAWADHIDMVERLTGLAGAIVLADEAEAARRSPGGVGVGASIEARVADRVARLTDDARVRAYETLGERPKAVQIMERRLLPD